MKNRLPYICVLLLCLIFSGCPYESNVPIDKPKEKIKQNYLGIWTEEHFEFNIKTLDPFTYLHQTKNKFNHELSDTAASYITTIRGVSFLNLYKYKSGNPPDEFSLYKLEMIGDKLL